MTIFDDDALGRLPNGTPEEQIARMNRVQAYCKKLPQNVQGAYMELAAVAGYDEAQLKVLEKWCAHNSINITEYQTSVLETLYNSLEQKRVYEEYFLNIAKAMKEHQNDTLARFKEDIVGSQSEVIDAFTIANNEVNTEFLRHLAAFEKLTQNFSPSSDLSAQFTQAILLGVTSGIKDQVDALSAGVDHTLSNHVETFNKVAAQFDDRMTAIHNEISSIKSISPDSLITPLVGLMKAQLDAHLNTIEGRFTALRDSTDSTVQSIGKVSVKEMETVRNKALSSMESARKKVENLTNTSVEAIKNKTKWEWVRHAALISGVYLVANLAMTSIFFKYVWPHIT